MSAVVLGLKARLDDDLVSPHFDVGELTKHRGWWKDDVEGEVARYLHLCLTVLEPARVLLGNHPMTIISGARPLGFNERGRASSMHLPPVQRASKRYQFLSREPDRRGAAVDFIPQRMRCDQAFWALNEAQRSGKILAGGLFWYSGPDGGAFLHIDDRGELAREAKLTPPT